jgi:hypothetical protein
VLCVIEAQRLTKRYGDKLAVDELSFTVRPGVVTGFLGPNGSGRSSHLMSEMAVTADEVVIIGKGRLIAEISIVELLAQSSQRYVRVRSPELEKLHAALDGQGAQTTFEDGALSVHGMGEVAIGDLAASLSVTLHELSPRSASLEEAFMELTEESVEYHESRRTLIDSQRWAHHFGVVTSRQSGPLSGPESTSEPDTSVWQVMTALLEGLLELGRVCVACTAVVAGGGQASHYRLRGGTQNGRHYAVPVAYTRHGGRLLVASQFAWVRNLRSGEPVEIRLGGRRRAADVQVLRDEAGVVEHLGLMARDNHQFAKFNKIGFDEHGDPSPDLHLAWAAGTRVALLTPR